MNAHTRLWRQIHPGWVEDGRVTSQAFKPTEKDAGQLSVDDGDQISPCCSWQRYTQCYKSIGVTAVTVSECRQYKVKPTPDPKDDKPEHVLVDFRDLSKSQRKKVGQKLADFANARGWQYNPCDLPALVPKSSS